MIRRARCGHRTNLLDVSINLRRTRHLLGPRKSRVAILGVTLFMGTIDAHLLAIDARSGQLLWKTQVASAAARYSITHAPLVAKDKCDRRNRRRRYGHPRARCRLHVQNREGSLRFHTIPGPGEQGNDTWSGDSWKTGGAGVWNSGRTIPRPISPTGGRQSRARWDGRQRLGDNLYSDSVVALERRTGALKWHYQFTPADEIDYDYTQVPVLSNIDWRGQPRKVMLWANRNGLAYVLDRTTGESCWAARTVKVNWMEVFDPKGRPSEPRNGPVPKGRSSCRPCWAPPLGAPPSFIPRTGLFLCRAVVKHGHVVTEGGRPRGVGNHTHGTGDADAEFQEEEEDTRRSRVRIEKLSRRSGSSR